MINKAFDIVTYKKYVFVHLNDQNIFLIHIWSSHSSGHTAPKILLISWAVRAMRASFVKISGLLSSIPKKKTLQSHKGETSVLFFITSPFLPELDLH